MSNFDFEGYSEGEWEDRGDLAWNEFDWERYLRSQEKVFGRYLELYAQLKTRTDRLDRIAQQMGWDTDEWTGNDFLSDVEELSDESELPDEEGDDLDPYTLHKHPIFIATQALYMDTRGRWLNLLSTANLTLPPAVAAAYQASLSAGETNAVAAIHALDMGDYALAVCQFKRALADLNRSFYLLDRLTLADEGPAEQYREEALRRLFDLREIWLRVMQYCREEVDRRIRGDD